MTPSLLVLALNGWSVDPPAVGAPSCVDRATALPGIQSDDVRLQSTHLMVVRKAMRRVQLFSHGTAATGSGFHGRACYRVGLGFAPDGHKQREGDGRTPEGWYTTSDKPWSSFYGAIAVHYPNDADARTARQDGRITSHTSDSILRALEMGKKPPQTTALGGEILLHGGGGGTDWTLGCIALDDRDLDDLRSHLPKSMQIDLLILP